MIEAINTRQCRFHYNTYAKYLADRRGMSCYADYPVLSQIVALYRVGYIRKVWTKLKTLTIHLRQQQIN